jgi:ubiquinol-cytochrome c reductase iron-sulfur subunit
MNRRQFLYTTTTIVTMAGLGLAAWPFFDQLNPDAPSRASGGALELDASTLRDGEQRLQQWHSRPISVVRRTDAMLAAMQDRAFVAKLLDSDSQKRRQPAYAKNWHRSIDPRFAVLIAVCPTCACGINYTEKQSSLEMAGGYVCPCCATRYDPAGRVYSGLPRFNLAVPPYDFIKPARIVIGKNAGGEHFSLESVEAS